LLINTIFGIAMEGKTQLRREW